MVGVGNFLYVYFHNIFKSAMAIAAFNKKRALFIIAHWI
jgi:hypothetical protein